MSTHARSRVMSVRACSLQENEDEPEALADAPAPQDPQERERLKKFWSKYVVKRGGEREPLQEPDEAQGAQDGSDGSEAEPEGSEAEPEGSEGQPADGEGSEGQPDGSEAEPEGSEGQPDGSEAAERSDGQSDGSEGQPDASQDEPGASQREPDASQAETEASQAEPDASQGEGGLVDAMEEASDDYEPSEAESVPNVPCGADGRGFKRSYAQFFPEEEPEEESSSDDEDFSTILAQCGRVAQSKACSGKDCDKGASLKLPDEPMPDFFGFPMVPTPVKKRPASWFALPRERSSYSMLSRYQV